MRILVVSDTHGNLNGLKRALESERGLDWVLHMGDVDRQENELAELVMKEAGSKCSLACIRGNNDYYSSLGADLTLDINGIKIWMTHGHRYDVYSGTAGLKNAGIMRGVDVVMYGHTHMPLIEKDEGAKITVINPGSVTKPRQIGRQPSYIMMEIEEGKEPVYEIKYMEKIADSGFGWPF